jgi:hypothetical protein
LGPEHLLLRFRTYDEYPTEEQARWRMIELLVPIRKVMNTIS